MATTISQGKEVAELKSLLEKIKGIGRFIKDMNDPDKMTYEKAIYLLENDGEVDGDDEFMTAYWMAVDALREKAEVNEVNGECIVLSMEAYADLCERAGGSRTDGQR